MEIPEITQPAPPFSSRKAAAGALSAEFPEHNDLIRVGGPSLDALSQELLMKRDAYRRLSLDIARLECEIKQRIGLFRGLRTRVGTWYWEKTRERTRIDWLGLAQDLKITEKLKAAYSRVLPPTRILRFEKAKESVWQEKR